MTLEEAVKLAKNGVKMTHTYFTSDEYITMRGNMVVFEDGVHMYLLDWIKDKDYLNDGWSKFDKS